MHDVSIEELIQRLEELPEAESDRLEIKATAKAKTNKGRKEIAKVASALANNLNRENGSILIGVAERQGSVVVDGIPSDTTDELKRDISQSLRSNTNPKIHPKQTDLGWEKFDGSYILRIDVEPGREVIRFNEDGEYIAYTRADSTTQEMTDKEKEEFKESGRPVTRRREVSEKMDEYDVKKSSDPTSRPDIFDTPEWLPQFESQGDYLASDFTNDRLLNVIFKSPSRESGMRFETPLVNLEDITEALDLVDAVADLLVARPEYTFFSISQENRNWFGRGVTEFKSCIIDYKNRYEAYPDDLSKHTSELALLTLDTEYGRVSIRLYYRVSEEGIGFRYGRLILTTSGVPFETFALSRLLESFGSSMDPGTEFELDQPRELRGRQTPYHFGQNIENVEVEVEQEIMSWAGSDIVEYVLIKNPLVENPSLLNQRSCPPVYADILTNLEHLMCSINRERPASMIEGYELMGLSIFNTEPLHGDLAVNVTAVLNAETKRS